MYCVSAYTHTDTRTRTDTHTHTHTHASTQVPCCPCCTSCSRSMKPVNTAGRGQARRTPLALCAAMSLCLRCVAGKDTLLEGLGIKQRCTRFVSLTWCFFTLTSNMHDVLPFLYVYSVASIQLMTCDDCAPKGMRLLYCKSLNWLELVKLITAGQKIPAAVPFSTCHVIDGGVS